MLFRGSCFRQEGVIGALHQQLGKAGKQIRQFIEMGNRREGIFIHINAAINFDLEGMKPLQGATIMLGYEAAGIRAVHFYFETKMRQDSFYRIGQGGMTAGAIAITQNDVWAVCRIGILQHAGGHRMAIDQTGIAEIDMGEGHLSSQRLMIGFVECFDALQPFFYSQAVFVDLAAFCNDSGDRPEATAHPSTGAFDVGRQRGVEHAWIEFIGLPVEIEESTRKMGLQQRQANIGHLFKQEINESIFRPA